MIEARHSNAVMNAVRAEEQALNYQRESTLNFHRMVFGKSLKALEKLDKKLSEIGQHEDAVRVIRARLQARISDERKIDRELKAIGQRQAKA